MTNNPATLKAIQIEQKTPLIPNQEPINEHKKISPFPITGLLKIILPNELIK